MQSLSRMQKHTVNPHTVHRRLQLAAYLATLAYSADHQFSAPVDRVYQLRNCARQILCGQVVGAVQVFEVSEGVAFGGYDMEGRGEGIPVSLSVGVGKGHVDRVLGLRLGLVYRVSRHRFRRKENRREKKRESPKGCYV